MVLTNSSDVQQRDYPEAILHYLAIICNQHAVKERRSSDLTGDLSLRLAAANTAKIPDE